MTAKRSLFEGWTKEKQCFGPFHDSGRRCAMGWLHQWINTELYFATIRRVAPLLRERFPEIPVEDCFDSDPAKQATYALIYANDQMRLDPEVFRSLDQEALDREAEASAPVETVHGG
jgi:hypothetical protein